MLQDKPLKALHDDGCECNGLVVIEAGHCGLLQDRDDGGSLETHQDDGAVQGCVKDASWSAHPLSTLPRMLSGPTAFSGLTLLRVFLTSSLEKHSI